MNQNEHLSFWEARLKHVFPCRTCPSCNWGIRTQGDESELETGLKLPLTPNAAISAQQSPAKPSDFCGKWFPERLPDPCEFVDQLIQLIVRFQMKKIEKAKTLRRKVGKSGLCRLCSLFSSFLHEGRGPHLGIGLCWAVKVADRAARQGFSRCSLQPAAWNIQRWTLFASQIWQIWCSAA